jgi:hypothetical protein
MIYILCSSGKLRLGRYLKNAGSMEWVFECQEYDLATTIGEKTFTTCIGVSVPAPNVPVVDEVGTGIFPQHKYSATKQVPAPHPAPPFYLFLSPLPSPFTRTRQ